MRVKSCITKDARFSVLIQLAQCDSSLFKFESEAVYAAKGILVMYLDWRRYKFSAD